VTTQVSGIDAAFYPAAWKVGLALGLSPATAGFDVAQILYSESGITPTSINSIGCGGINGFCPGSLTTSITMSAFRQLTASQQLLQYVWPFWAARVRSKGGIDRAVDLYWLNWYPATYVRGAAQSYVVNPNVGALDSSISHGKSYATVADLQAFLDRVKRQARWKAVAKNLAPYAIPGLTVEAARDFGPYIALGLAGALWWYLVKVKKI
jgi:hypothetical protein